MRMHAQKRGNAPGRPVLDALQAMLARKAYDALQASFALRSSGEDAKWGAHRKNLCDFL